MGNDDYKKGGKWKPPSWQSKKAPGTPPALEAIFEMIQSGKTDSKAFEIARATQKCFNDAELWEAYVAWTEGRIHPVVAEKKPPFRKPAY